MSGARTIIDGKTKSEIPDVVRLGMLRKIEDTLGNTADGHPATRGNPMEAEARYYYNFYLTNAEFDFEYFLTLLSKALRERLPNIDITLDWLRACDRAGKIETARRVVQGLRIAARQNLNKGAGYWERFWNLTEILIENFDLSHADIGIESTELELLTRHYLLEECRAHVETLKAYMAQGKVFQARKAFVKLDDLLHGVPMSIADFRHTQNTCYTAKGAYEVYRATVTAHPIDPVLIAWSFQEHRWCERFVFPNGKPEKQQFVTSGLDPTAPAAALTLEPVDLESLNDDQITVAEAMSADRPAETPPNMPVFVTEILEVVKRQVQDFGQQMLMPIGVVPA